MFQFPLTLEINLDSVHNVTVGRSDMKELMELTPILFHTLLLTLLAL